MGVQNSKLKPKVLADLLQQTEFSREEIKEWYRGFRKDYGKGYITIDEFKKIYDEFYPDGDGDAFAEHTFRIFDRNHDGKIDFREFISGLSISSRGSYEEKMTWLFDLYDTNANGFISKDEMLVIIKSVFQMSDNKSHKIDPTLAESRVEKIYEKLDRNLDGLLSLEEFIELGRTDPTLCHVLTGDMAEY